MPESAALPPLPVTPATAPSAPCAATIGNFDGVHVGHRALIDRVVDTARARSLLACAVTFHPHPARVLGRSTPPPLLTTPSDRVRLLRAAGVDRVALVPFTSELAASTPEAFVRRVLIERLAVRHVVVGADFVFGAGRAGTVSVLAELGARLGFTVEAVAAVTLPGHGVVSSTRVRQCVREGDVSGAAHLLGRPYHLHGVVVEGAQRGRLLGFPTANLRGENELVPPSGVYAGFLDWGQGYRPAAISVGDNPTFGDTGFTVEAHVLRDETQSEALSLYGRTCHLAFVAHLRGQVRFGGPDALAQLTTQIGRDVEAARHVLSRTPPPASILNVDATTT
jgi:riboflavin kinase/FMN adenylyltransferase